MAEARAAEAAGADVVVAQGMEAGGHRGCFDAARAEAAMVGLFALLPAVVDAVRVPVVATGGIADARGVAAALLLGAQRRADRHRASCAARRRSCIPAWADALARTLPEDTMVSRAFSGRAGRSIATAYARAATGAGRAGAGALSVQRGLTQAMRSEAAQRGDVDAHAGLGRPVGCAGARRRPRARSCARSGTARRPCSGKPPAA